MNIENHSYSKNINNKKILIFGPKLPPIGGVSVHIQRVSRIYEKNNNLINIFDCTQEIIGQSKISYIFKIFKIIKKFKPDIVDYHTSFLKYYIHELLILILLKSIFKFKINIIDHDPRYLYKKNNFQKKLLSFLIIFINKQIIIGSSTYNCYLDNKVKIKSNFSLESPFLPPDTTNIKELLKLYPSNLFEFIKSHEKIILMNAFNIALLEGKDLYGIDRALNLISYLSKLSFDGHKNIGLVLLYQLHDPEYFKIINEKIKNLGIKHNIFLLQGEYLLWPLFSKATVFIRPTISDSYGISIEESIYFETPAIASNVCQRPKGTILFDINDNNDLFNKVYNLLM